MTDDHNLAGWIAASDRLSSALILDTLDALGLRQQALRSGVVPRTKSTVAIGAAKTLLWLDFNHDDPKTYELELKAVDSIRSGEMVVCATSNSARSGIWGELLTTAAQARGAAGIVTDGAIRDLAPMEVMGFPVYSRYVCPYDSLNRQKVVGFDVRVQIDDVTIEPGDVIVADRDGVAVVPRTLADRALEAALAKAAKEDGFRNAVKNGASLTDAYERFGVL